MTQTDLFNLQYAPGPKIWTGEGGKYTYSYYPFNDSFQSFSEHAPTKDGPVKDIIGEIKGDNIFVLDNTLDNRFIFSNNTNYCVKVGSSSRCATRTEMANTQYTIPSTDLLKYKYSVSLSVNQYDYPEGFDPEKKGYSTELSPVFFQLKDKADDAKKSIVELYWINSHYFDSQASQEKPLLLIKYFNIPNKPTEIIGPEVAFGLNKKFHIVMYFDPDTKKAVLDISNDDGYVYKFISRYSYEDILGDIKDVLFKTGNYNQLDGSVFENKNKFSIISFYKMNISKI